MTLAIMATVVVAGWFFADLMAELLTVALLVQLATILI